MSVVFTNDGGTVFTDDRKNTSFVNGLATTVFAVGIGPLSVSFPSSFTPPPPIYSTDTDDPPTIDNTAYALLTFPGQNGTADYLITETYSANGAGSSGPNRVVSIGFLNNGETFQLGFSIEEYYAPEGYPDGIMELHKVYVTPSGTYRLESDTLINNTNAGQVSSIDKYFTTPIFYIKNPEVGGNGTAYFSVAPRTLRFGPNIGPLSTQQWIITVSNDGTNGQITGPGNIPFVITSAAYSVLFDSIVFYPSSRDISIDNGAIGIGANERFGFGGVTPVLHQPIGADATDLASAIARINQTIAGLIALGWLYRV